VSLVSLVFKAVDLNDVLREVAHRTQVWHCLMREFSTTLQNRDLLRNLGGDFFQLVQDDEVGGLFHVVHAVVKRGRQASNVIPVKRGHKGLVQAAHDRVGGVVRVVLGV